MGDARRSNRNIKPTERKDKENQKKRERPGSRSMREAGDSGSGDGDADSDGPSRKRAKSPARNDGYGSDLIEDSDDGGNAFVAFARPGTRPQPAAKPQARSSRAAAARASHRISSTAAKDDHDDFVDGDDDDDDDEMDGAGNKPSGRAGRPPPSAKGRPSRGAATAAKAYGVDDDDDEENEEGSLSSESEDEDDGGGSDVEEVVTRGKAPAGRPGGAGGSGRPTRRCVERRTARAAAAAANMNAKKVRRQLMASSESGGDDESDEEEEEEEEDGDYTDGRKGAAAKAARGRGGGGGGSIRRAPARGKAARPVYADDDEDEDDDDDESEQEDEEKEGTDGTARGSGGDDDSDVELLEDDDDGEKVGEDDKGEEDSSSSDGEESESEEQEDDEVPVVKRGRGRPPKNGAKAVAPAPGKRGRGRPPKGQAGRPAKASVAAAPAAGGGSGKSKEVVEKILSYDSEKDMYLVKLEDTSYRRTTYMSQDYLEKHKRMMLRMFYSKGLTVEVDPDWLKVDRVIASRTVNRGSKGPARQLLVKWRGLEYSDSTWEYESDLEAEEDKAAVARFERFNAPPGSGSGRTQQAGGRNGNPAALRQPDFKLPTFQSGRSLRDYQQVSVRWMINNYNQRRNCILGDEMGLGKTAQSISTLQTIREVGGVQGPFLIVAPLSTLGHWQREVETWTDMNVVLLAGSAADRAVILEHEFYRPASGNGGRGGGGGGRAREIKFHVLLVSYETLRQERHQLRTIPWSAAVFDEAHRLKGINSSTRAVVEDLDIVWLLLLTGTPVQNNMLELYSILSLLDPDGYPSQDDFTSRFGGDPSGPPPTVQQIRALQAALAPILLRRMKEDVEELPQKEEVVVWVELTAAQRAYYRALYEGQIAALLGGPSVKNLPGMRNLAMELRKLCCHPVLCEGLEEDLKLKLAAQRSAAGSAPPEFSNPELELLVRGSGKMVLLHKLLHKLRAEGRRVLIFSQFVIMLNVLEDYCNAVGFPVERIDGSIRGRDRQQAIDRFSAEGEGSEGNAFVFLLSTRAGGQGITLTAADTCIIYDSDWNPQNDLQAMARCHRIGQKKEVTVYRLVSKDTYEMALFNSASRKYGLDEAILGCSGGSDPESDSARIADLLRHGAHGLLADMDAGAKKGEDFASEDINQILTGRTEKRQIGSRAGNTFSVATFAADDGLAGTRGGGAGGRGRHRKRARAPSADGDDEDYVDEEGAPVADEDYWRTLMPDAVAAHEARAAQGPEVLGPRVRKQVNYNMNHKKYNPKIDSDSEKEPDTDPGTCEKRKPGRPRRSDAAERPDGEWQQDDKPTRGRGRPRSSGVDKASVVKPWTRLALKALEDRLAALGPDRWSEVYEQLQPIKYSVEQVEAAGRAMWELYGIAAALAAQRGQAQRKAQAERDAAMIDFMMREDDDAFARPTDRAGAAGTAGAGAAGPVTAPPAPPPPSGPSAAAAPQPGATTPDEYEEKLAKAIAEQVPEFLRAALAGPPVLKRLLKESSEILRHGKMMTEIAKLMLPAVAPPAAAAADAAGTSGGAAAVNGLRAPYLPPPAGTLMSWWNRSDDEALLMAVAKVGYPPSRPGRPADYALRNGPLASRVALKPEPEEPKSEGGQGGKEEKKAEASEDQERAEAGGQQPQQQQTTTPVAPSLPKPRAPGPDGPLLLSQDEWRYVASVVSRRIVRLVPATLDFHRKLSATQTGMQPLAMAKPARPSAPQPPPPASAAAGAGAGRPHSAAAQPTAPAAAAPAAVKATPPTAAVPVAKAAPPAVVVAAPATLAGVVTSLVASVAAAAKRASEALSPLKAAPAAAAATTTAVAKPGAETKPLQLQAQPPPAAKTVATQPPAAAGGGGAAAQQQPQVQLPAQPQQQPRAADPQRRKSGDVKHHKQQSIKSVSGAAATPTGGGGKASGLKQSTLPFARVSNPGPGKTPTVAAGTTPAAAATGEGGAVAKKLKLTTAATEEGAPGAKKQKLPQQSPGAAMAKAVKSPLKAQPLAKAVAVGKASATAAAGQAPGSAGKPIEVDESD